MNSFIFHAEMFYSMPIHLSFSFFSYFCKYIYGVTNILVKSFLVMAKKKQKKKSGVGQQFLSESQFVKQRVRSLEIGQCYMSDGLLEHGEGDIIISRKHTGGRLSFASFLVDVWCVGVKDSFFKLRREEEELEDICRDFHLVECSYEEAHNWIYGAIEFADEAGIEPDKSFALTQFFLEEDTDDIPLVEHEFGYNGQHFLVAHSGLEASRYLPLLREHLGEGNFQYVIGEGMPGDDMADDDETLTMMEIIADVKKAELNYYGRMLNLSLDDNLDEEALRRQYCEQVLENAQKVVEQLPVEEISILLYSTVDNEHTKRQRTTDNYHDILLLLLGLAYVEHSDGESVTIRVASDFLEKARPYLDLKGNEMYVLMHSLVQNIEGLVNLRGIVSLDEVEDLMTGLINIEDDTSAVDIVDSLVSQNAILKWMSDKSYVIANGEDEDADDKVFFVTRYTVDSYSELVQFLYSQEIQKRPKKEFSIDEIISASGIHDGLIYNPEQDNFSRILRMLDFDDKENEICRALWVKANMEDCQVLENGHCKTYFRNKVLRGVAETHPMFEQAMRTFEEYVDNIPRWIYRGYSPVEWKKLATTAS